MNLDFLLISIILSFATLAVFGIFIAINILLDNTTIKKWRQTGKSEQVVITKNIAIKIIQIFIITTACFLIMVLQQIIQNKNQQQLLVNLFYIPIIFSIGLVFSGWISVGISLCLITCIVIDYVVVSPDELTFFVITSFQVIVLLIFNTGVCVNRITKKNLSNIYVFLTSIPQFILVYVLEGIFFYNKIDYMIMMMIQTTIIWVLYLVVYQCLLWYYQFANKVKSIDNSKIYENQYFINANHAFDIVQKHIKNNNIDFGVIIIFDLINFNRLPNLWGNSATKYIQHLVLNDLVKSFKELNPIFFMTNNNEYACFVNLKSFNGDLQEIYEGNSKQIRAANDAVKQIQNCMLNLPKSICYQDKIQQIYAGAYAAIYGVHSYDLNQLIRLCTVTKQKSSSSKRGVILDVYNPSVIKFIKPIENKFFINKVFAPHDFQIKLEVNKDISEHFDVFQAQVTCVNKLLFGLEEIKSFAWHQNVYDNTLRMISMQVLKKFVSLKNCKKHCIILDYPINFVISEQFNLGDFKTKLQTLNLLPENIILRFDCTELSTPFIDNNNLINIKNMGIKLLFSNVNDNNINLLQDMQPNFLSLENNCACFEVCNEISKLLTKLNIKLLTN